MVTDVESKAFGEGVIWVAPCNSVHIKNSWSEAFVYGTVFQYSSKNLHGTGLCPVPITVTRCPKLVDIGDDIPYSEDVTV